MIRIGQLGIVAAASLVATPAIAGKEVLHPVQVGRENVRFSQGIFTLDLRGARGAVMLSPAPADHRNVSFDIAVFNDSDEPANIDVTNIAVVGGPEPIRLLSKDEMVQKAESRAAWAGALTALAGGLAAASAASARNHYTATTLTPRGSITTFIDAPDPNAAINAAAITAGTGVTLAAIQGNLDRARAQHGNEMVQLTTVDPRQSYAGRIYLTRFKRKALPMDLRITVRFNGEEFPFAVRFVKKGTPAPEFKPVLIPATTEAPTAPLAPVPAAAPALTPATVPAPASTR